MCEEASSFQSVRRAEQVVESKVQGWFKKQGLQNPFAEYEEVNAN
jgi:hypothetical protein